MATLKILIVSRSRSAADRLEKGLANNSKLKLTTRIISNGHADPLEGVTDDPDLLLLHYGPGQSELQFLADRDQQNQLPLIVCGPSDDPEAMRLAMRAGARDYLPEDVAQQDLVASVSRIQEEVTRTGKRKSGQLIVFINGKGGSGGSFLATNLAHNLVVDAEKSVTLFDLDLQFGGLCRYLDITPKIGIQQALESSKDMDEISAQAYTYEHSSGLRLLAAPSKRFTLPSEVAIDELEALLDIFLLNNDYIVADSPNRLDAVTEFFLKRADKVIVIVQQSLPNVQDAARMLHLLTSELYVSPKRIGVVVNRYSRNSPIEIDDMLKALHQKKLITVPNQYKVAAEAIDSGVPVTELSKNGALAKGIRNLRTAIANPEGKSSENFLQRALPSILRR